MNRVSPLNSSAFKARYLDTMQRSIGEHLDDLERIDATVFDYRKNNLRPAIEKKLYFQCLHDRQRMGRFHKALQNNERAMVPVASQSPSMASRKLRHFVRRLRQITAGKWACPASEVIVFASTPKHLHFATRVLEGITYRAYSFDPKVTDAECLAKHTAAAVPNLRGCSDYLIAQHYDLLVEYELIARLITASRTKKVVLIEGNTAHDCLFSIAAGSEAETVCLQYGWAFQQHLGFQHLPHHTLLTWGKAFSEVLRPTNEHIRFVETGHPLLETEVLTQDTPRDSVLIIMQAPVGWIGQDSFDAFTEAIRTLARQLPETRFTVREHPSWPLSNELCQTLSSPNVEITDPYQVSLGDQLAQAICTITIYSSVAFEAQLAGSIPIFALLKMKLDITPDMVSDGIAEQVHSAEELCACVKQIIEDESHARAMRQAFTSRRQDYFAFGGAESVQRVQQQLSHS